MKYLLTLLLISTSLSAEVLKKNADGDFVFNIQRMQTSAFALGGAAVIQVLFLIVGIVKLIANAQTVVGSTGIKMRRVF